jgi:hypothetical protein
VRTQADVLELLIKLASLNSPQTDLSDERAKTLWESADNVLTEETRRYSISLRFCFVHNEQPQKI